MISRHLTDPLLGFCFAESDESGADASDETSSDEGKTTGSDIETIEEALDALDKARTDAKKKGDKYRSVRDELNEIKPIKEKFDKFKSLFEEGEEPDPEKLQNEISNYEQELKSERKKSSVMIATLKNDGDADLVVPYLESKGLLKDVDPTDSEQINKIVTKALEDKPSLKNGKAVTTGDDGKDTSNSKADMNSWVRGLAKK